MQLSVQKSLLLLASVSMLETASALPRIPISRLPSLGLGPGPVVNTRKPTASASQASSSVGLTDLPDITPQVQCARDGGCEDPINNLPPGIEAGGLAASGANARRKLPTAPQPGLVPHQTGALGFPKLPTEVCKRDGGECQDGREPALNSLLSAAEPSITPVETVPTGTNVPRKLPKEPKLPNVECARAEGFDCEDPIRPKLPHVPTPNDLGPVEASATPAATTLARRVVPAH